MFEDVYWPSLLIIGGLFVAALAATWYGATRKKDKDFVWWAVRVGTMAFMLLFLAVGSSPYSVTYTNPGLQVLMGWAIIAALVFLIVVSIIHLINHSEKAFPITLLVMIPMLVLFGLAQMVINETTYEEDVCFSYCTQELSYAGYEWYYVDWENYVCECLDVNENVLLSISLLELPIYGIG